MLDQSQLANLSPDEAQRYHALERLFQSDGWELFMEHVSGWYQSAQADVIAADTWEANRLAKGGLAVLHSVLSIEDKTENEFIEMAAVQQASDEDAAIEVELDYE